MCICFQAQYSNVNTTDPEIVIPSPIKVPPTILEATLCSINSLKYALHTLENAPLVIGSIASTDNVNIPAKTEHNYDLTLSATEYGE